MVEFLDDPNRPLDTACIDELPEVSFVTELTRKPVVTRTMLVVRRGPIDAADTCVAFMIWQGLI